VAKLQSCKVAGCQSSRVDNNTKQILFLISDTGGGHRAAATAMAQAIHNLYPQRYRTVIHDIWSHETGWPINQMPSTYSWLTTKGQLLWRLLWSAMSRRWLHASIFRAITPLIQAQLTHYLQQLQPDLIVSVHPLMNHLGIQMRECAGLTAPFVTVITDLITIHPTWLCPTVDHCFVPTEAARHAALNYGMPAAKIKKYGYPVRLNFTDSRLPHPRSPALVRVPTTILLLGNNHTVDIAHALLEQIPNANLQIVTGQNQALYERLQYLKWPESVQLYSFVENMAALMNAADLLITKAGPGVNVEYVEKHALGTYISEPNQIAQLAQQWLSPDNPTLSQMSANAQHLAKPNAVFEIAEALCDLC